MRLQQKPKKNKSNQPVFGTSNSLEAQVNFLFAIQNDMAKIWKPLHEFSKQDPLVEYVNGLDTLVNIFNNKMILVICLLCFSSLAALTKV